MVLIMKKQSVIVNYIAELIYNVELVLIPLILTPYVSRVLGPDGVGSYGYVQALTVYFTSLANLGTSIYAQKEIAKCAGDTAKEGKLLTDIIRIRLVLCAFGLCVMLALAYYINDFRNLILIQIISLLACGFDTTWFYYGKENFKSVTYVFGVSRFISLICVFFLVKEADDLLIYAVIFVFCDLLSQFILSIPVLRIFIKNISNKFLYRQHVKPILGLVIPQFSAQMYSVIDRVMIVRITSSVAENGLYEQSTKIINVLNAFLVETIGVVLLPRMSKLFAEGNSSQAKKEIQLTMDVLLWIMWPLVLGLIGVSSVFVPWFLGPEFEKAVDLVRILALNLIPVGIYTLIGKQILIPLEKENVYTKSILAGVVTNVLLNVLFIFLWGAVGACLASFISNCVIAIYQVSKTNDIFSMKSALFHSGKSFVVSLIMLFSILFIKKRMVNGFGSLVLFVLCGIAIYIMGMIILKDKLGKMLLAFARERVKERLKKNMNKVKT